MRPWLRNKNESNSKQDVAISSTEAIRQIIELVRKEHSIYAQYKTFNKNGEYILQKIFEVEERLNAKE